jgi:hypothetical protein
MIMSLLVVTVAYRTDASERGTQDSATTVAADMCGLRGSWRSEPSPLAAGWQDRHSRARNCECLFSGRLMFYYAPIVAA